jgi:hypothetical protein
MVDFNTEDIFVVIFISIALYNFIELHVLILSHFRRRKGLYFWSFTIATWGVAFNSIGYLLKHRALTTSSNLYATLILIGWCTMVSGQSVVLYSRLHLLMDNKTWLRAVLIMIITNAVCMDIPVIVLVYGSNSSNPTPFEEPYSIYEKLQLCAFFVQELVLSGLYIWETTKLLKPGGAISNSGIVRFLNHLIYVNVFIILLDLTVLGLEFANMYTIQTAWKPLVYSIKLKLEFSILNRLVELIRPPGNDTSYSHSQSAA